MCDMGSPQARELTSPGACEAPTPLLASVNLAISIENYLDLHRVVSCTVSVPASTAVLRVSTTRYRWLDHLRTYLRGKAVTLGAAGPHLLGHSYRQPRPFHY